MLQRLLIVITLLLATTQLSWAVLDINTASEADLQNLSGIGPTRAKAIVADRKKNGAFKKVDDLARVKGIGPKTLDALRADITVGPAKSVAKPAVAAPHAKPAATPVAGTAKPAAK